MKKRMLLKGFCIALLLCCISGKTYAQDWKSILTGVAKEVVGDKITTASSIVGTWNYVAPECKFESDDLLAKAGGEVASKKVEDQMQTVYDKIGLSGCQFTFNEDGSYSYKLKKRTVSGTYTFNDTDKTITMSAKLGIKLTAQVTVAGNNMSLVFNTDKLMSALQTITGAVSKVNDTASSINSLISTYDGLRLGFELEK
ncbi:DUF4923 family protein [Phocaeicola sp.]|uniref:DUF4923 family protein n=1 Tax=Phocaeicola sp. TaxID=2773926 RepID=UPI0038649926